jgi:hypothetical protein
MKDLERLSEISRGFLGHPEVGGSMEAVPPDVMERVKAVGQRIDKSMGRHGLVEGRIENRYLRHARENFAASIPRRSQGQGGARYDSEWSHHPLIDQPAHGKLPHGPPGHPESSADLITGFSGHGKMCSSWFIRPLVFKRTGAHGRGGCWLSLSPIRSSNPDETTEKSELSNTSYLTEELPELMTTTFMRRTPSAALEWP